IMWMGFRGIGWRNRSSFRGPRFHANPPTQNRGKRGHAFPTPAVRAGVTGGGFYYGFGPGKMSNFSVGPKKKTPKNCAFRAISSKNEAPAAKDRGWLPG